MMIDKEQPMRETLSDTVDFINNNLAIGEIAEGIGALDTRVSAIENFINSENIGIAVASTELETPFQQQHVTLEVPLPDGITSTDIIITLHDENMLSPNMSFDAISYGGVFAYSRYLNHKVYENKVVFHWYPQGMPSSGYSITFTGIVLYKGRSSE